MGKKNCQSLLWQWEESGCISAKEKTNSELAKLDPIPLGDVVITGAGELPFGKGAILKLFFATTRAAKMETELDLNSIANELDAVHAAARQAFCARNLDAYQGKPNVLRTPKP